MNTISINVHNPTICHVKSVMQPSMKSGTYYVWLMLQRCEMGHANVLRATCECAAGYVLIIYNVYTYKINRFLKLTF